MPDDVAWNLRDIVPAADVALGARCDLHLCPAHKRCIPIGLKTTLPLGPWSHLLHAASWAIAFVACGKMVVWGKAALCALQLLSMQHRFPGWGASELARSLSGALANRRRLWRVALATRALKDSARGHTCGADYF